MGRWLFVTAASASIGYGHVSRARLLSQAAHRLGLQVDVITPPGSAPSDRPEAGPRWLEAEWTPDALREIVTVDPLPSVIVMDAPDDWLQVLSHTQSWLPDRGSPLVTVFRSDGPASAADTFEHVSLTPTFETPRTTPVQGPNGRFRRWSGRDLIFIRSSTFFREPTAKDDPPRIVISMGGADPYNITEQVCSSLLDHPVPARVAVVIGRLNPAADAIATKFAAHFEILHQGTFDFDDLLKRASIAIVNAGLTRYECIAAQTPFVAISMNDQQAQFTELVVREGFGVHAGVFSPNALVETTQAVHAWLRQPDALDEMRRRGQTMVDPENSTRFVQRIAAWACERRAQSNGDTPTPERQALDETR